MSEWIPEPWDCDDGEIFALADPDCPLASVHETSEGFEGDDPVARANARRIVAAVNACRGVPTEALEALQPGWWQRNAELRMLNVELAAAAEGLLDAIDRADATVAEFEGRIRAARTAIARARAETPPAGEGT
jgi:hypothetical protein